jgi:hypothetical protein
MPNVTVHALPTSRARLTPDLGALTTLVPPEIVDGILSRYGVVTRRVRCLPARQVVYLVLAMALFPSDPYQNLLTQLKGAWKVACNRPFATVTNSAISLARKRLPWQVIRDVFLALSAPELGASGGLWRNFRLVAIDGSSMEMADTRQNQAAFGGPTGNKGQPVGYPQLRIVALLDCHPRVPLAAEVGSFNQGECRLAAALVSKICEGMLVLADRGFVGVELLTMICQAGGHVLWRLKKGIAKRPVALLDDGTYLAKLSAHGHHGRGWITGKRPKPATVRIIEFRLNGELHRLMTTLLDPVQAPARELIDVYTQRWQIETFYRECKGDEQDRRRVLRSRTPDGVNQEIWACLIIQFLTRWLTCEVANDSQVDDPKKISFSRARAFIQGHLGPGLRLTLRRLLGWAIGVLTRRVSLVQHSSTKHSKPREVKNRQERYPVQGSRGKHPAPFAPASIVLQPRLDMP